MIKISLCMIVKNEEDVLGRCLDSAKAIADEIIIVDTGSTDRTKQIASQYTNLIYDFDWIDDFAAARNASFAKASGDYILWLDADDLILDKDRDAFLHLKETLPDDVSAVMMKYNVAFDAQGNPTFYYYRERLIRNGLGMRWEGAVHEAIAPIGRVIHSDIAITHKKMHSGDPDRNLRIFEKQIASGAPLEPRHEFYYARELYYHEQYEKAIQIFRRFLDGKQGWVENCIDACQQLANCYYKLNRPEQALLALLESFVYDKPRAEICCSLGKHFLDRDRYTEAIFWYNLAASCEPNGESGGFVIADCYHYIPFLQLCVCYDKLGNHRMAEEYNEKAAQVKPNSPQVVYNRTYFRSLREKANSQP